MGRDGKPRPEMKKVSIKREQKRKGKTNERP